MLPPLPSQHPNTSLSDELAAATNELLDLGRSASDRPPHNSSHEVPLPTPSPLNLASNNATNHRTLSSIISAGHDARLELIHDDEDDVPGLSTKLGGTPLSRSTGVVLESAEVPYDHDDNLPSSRLSSLIASVSNDTSFSSHTVPSPQLRMVDKAFSSEIRPSATESRINQTEGQLHRQRRASQESPHLAATLRAASIARQDRTPDFFTESFPDAQRSPNSDINSLLSPVAEVKHRTTMSPILNLGSPRPTQATLGDVSESQVTVKLHGNARLEREAGAASTTVEGDILMDLELASGSVRRLPINDEGDRSSLVSLPATSLTDSSQASSRVRPRARRRRSNGSYSIVSEDLSTVDDLPFARDVQIRGFTVVGEKARGFVCYDVCVITTRGTSISILRRFSSFVSLRASLASERAQYAKLVPSLPPKRSGLLHKYASHHLEKRRRALQRWLSIVMLDRRWATTKALQEWVVGNNDGS